MPIDRHERSRLIEIPSTSIVLKASWASRCLINFLKIQLYLAVKNNKY